METLSADRNEAESGFDAYFFRTVFQNPLMILDEHPFMAQQFQNELPRQRLRWKHSIVRKPSEHFLLAVHGITSQKSMNVLTVNCIDFFEVKRMKNRSAVRCVLAASGMTLLILDTNTALKGASDGIKSCMAAVIPSLLPFILLTCWMNDNISAEGTVIHPAIKKLSGFPEKADAILFSSVLGGYPAGAQAVYQAYSSGAVSKQEAERMLGYSNNAGPAFIFGMAGHMFPSVSASFLLWAIHLVSAFMARLMIGTNDFSSAAEIRPQKRSGDIIGTTAKVLCTICVWVIFFGIIGAYLDRWTRDRIPPVLKTVVFGALELVNGCCALPALDDVKVRFIVCSGMLGLGGLCVLMQTVSVVQGIGIKYYLTGKLIQSVFSIMISSAIVCHKMYLLIFCLVPPVIFILRSKNKGGNPAPIRV